jgi:hypothetical protein
MDQLEHGHPPILRCVTIPIHDAKRGPCRPLAGTPPSTSVSRRCRAPAAPRGCGSPACRRG